MINHRGTQGLAIVFLVFATLILSSYTLFRFHTGASFVEESFDSFSVFEQMNYEVNSLKTIFYLIGEQVIAEEYEKFEVRF